MEGLLLEVAKYGAVVTLLVVAILFFLRERKTMKTEMKEREDKCDLEIKTLNNLLRKQERENLELLHKLTATLDKIGDNNSDLHKELVNMKHTIEIKLEALKNKIKNNNNDDVK